MDLVTEYKAVEVNLISVLGEHAGVFQDIRLAAVHLQPRFYFTY